jgi:hypothetical protein
MSTEKKINIAKDFSQFPAGRYANDGPYTGEGFRKKILVTALKKYDCVVVSIDGTLGYGSSFLEEAFGGLVRDEGFTEEELITKLKIEGRRKSIIAAIREYIHNAQVVKNGGQENG